jgi:hypothetical protein
MISVTRVSALLAILLATACGGASSDGDIPAADPAGDTSEDELNTKARFTHLKKPTDADLAAFSTAAAKFDSSYRGVYRFNKAGPEATDPLAREKRIKEVMHRYMCSFFDESIDIGRNTGTTTAAVKQALSDVNIEDNASDQSSSDVTAITSALTKVYKNKKLDVLSGGASGNNTGGEVMGIYDLAHNEILFFGFTNCGSDD